MVRRTPAARFMAGRVGFPGRGGRSAGRRGRARAASAAIRELREEAGIELPAAAELIAVRAVDHACAERRSGSTPGSFWPSHRRGPSRGRRCRDRRLALARPATRSSARAAGDLPLAFPTQKQLERLSASRAVEAMLESRAAGARVRPIEPRVVGLASRRGSCSPASPATDRLTPRRRSRASPR